MNREVLLGGLRIIDSLRLPADCRSLARPSSALKPNHPLTGVRTRFFLINFVLVADVFVCFGVICDKWKCVLSQ